MALQRAAMNDVPVNSAAMAQRTVALAAYASGSDYAAALVAGCLADLPLDGALLIADATLAAERRHADPFGRIDTVLAQAPDWMDGHDALARLRWGAGDHDGFLGSVRRALDALPRHAGL